MKTRKRNGRALSASASVCVCAFDFKVRIFFLFRRIALKRHTQMVQSRDKDVVVAPRDSMSERETAREREWPHGGVDALVSIEEKKIEQKIMKNNKKKIKKKKKKTTANNDIPKADEWMDEWTRECEMREL